VGEANRKGICRGLAHRNGDGKFVAANKLLIANAARISGELESGDIVQVFPNPAVEDLQVSFSLSHEAHVPVVLFDMIGKEQGELFNSTLEAVVPGDKLM
jgi:hypothetical protein